MNLDYFKYCKELLIELEEAINSKNNYKIYELIPSLIPVVAITYFCLTEDIIISRDDKNPDINEKFSLNVPNSVIDKIFSYPELINITKKMTDSKLWLLSGIRNSIMHGATVIDIKNKKLIINNKSFKNQLECEIDLRWFTNYLLNTNIQLDITSKEFSVIFTEIIDQIDKNKDMNQLESDYIYANLIHFFKVDIKLKEGIKEQIPRDQIIRHIFEHLYNYIQMFNYSLKSTDELSFVACLKKSISKKENETEDEYNARVFKHFFKKHLKVNLEEKYPNYEFSVYAVKPKSEFKELLSSEEITSILNQKNIEAQMHRASSRITNELMKNLINPFEEETFFKDFIDIAMRIDSFIEPSYINPEDLQLLLSEEDEDILKGEENVVKKIRGYNVLANKTYDKIILRMIIQQDFKGPDFRIAIHLLRKLKAKYGYFGYDNEDALSTAKKECPYLFEKYSIILKEQNVLSDQDIVTLHNLPLDEIREFNQLLNQSKADLIKMIIYLSGINCYVLNKESVYDEHSDIYEEIIDDTFVAYSKTVYDHEYRLTKQSLEKIEAKLEKLNNMRFSDKTPKHVIDKHQEEIRSLEELKQTTLEQLNSYEVSVIDEINMVKVDNKNCSTLIRNSLSHPERIEVLEDLTIKLKDYDSKGILSGVVYVPFNNLINFFLNDAFDKKYQKANNKRS